MLQKPTRGGIPIRLNIRMAIENERMGIFLPTPLIPSKLSSTPFLVRHASATNMPTLASMYVVT